MVTFDDIMQQSGLDEFSELVEADGAQNGGVLKPSMILPPGHVEPAPQEPKTKDQMIDELKRIQQDFAFSKIDDFLGRYNVSNLLFFFLKRRIVFIPFLGKRRARETASRAAPDRPIEPDAADYSWPNLWHAQGPARRWKHRYDAFSRAISFQLNPNSAGIWRKSKLSFVNSTF